jgi:CBS-domain-containing membrane protein
MKIQDLMCRDVVVCQPTDSMKTAAERMWKADVGCLPVLDDQGTLMGMVTDRDLLMSAAIQGLPLDQLHVDSAMAHRVQALHPGDRVERALELMGVHQVRRLPVVDDQGVVVGLVSVNDLARRSDRDDRPRREDLVHAIAQVCEPRPRAQACVGPQGQLAASG